MLKEVQQELNQAKKECDDVNQEMLKHKNDNENIRTQLCESEFHSDHLKSVVCEKTDTVEHLKEDINRLNLEISKITDIDQLNKERYVSVIFFCGYIFIDSTLSMRYFHYL